MVWGAVYCDLWISHVFASSFKLQGNGLFCLLKCFCGAFWQIIGFLEAAYMDLSQINETNMTGKVTTYWSAWWDGMNLLFSKILKNLHVSVFFLPLLQALEERNLCFSSDIFCEGFVLLCWDVHCKLSDESVTDQDRLTTSQVPNKAILPHHPSLW